MMPRSVVVLLSLVVAAAADSMPAPWYRELSYSSESSDLFGNDVVLAQQLLLRSDAVDSSLAVDGYFGADSAAAVSAFQTAVGLSDTAVFDANTADALLSCCLADQYVDDGFTAASMGLLYKIMIPLPSANRSIETTATLLDENNTALRSFAVRLHGNRDDGTAEGWPDYGDGDFGLNELSTNGNTPTGKALIDLNSPEPSEYEAAYGPYPINRLVTGVEGNAGVVLGESPLGGGSMRSGVLLHTGEWPDWDDTMAMPNSAGCIHAHPEDVDAIWQILVDLGVQINDNPGGTTPYPYEPQGVISIYLEQ